MTQVVIFDFDGTIANTLDSILKLFNEIASDHDLPVIKDSDKEKVRNLSARELISEYHISPWKLLQLTKSILPKLKNNIKDISIVVGMIEVFKDLKKRGIKIGIVTSNSQENVELFLKSQNVTQIDFIHSEKSLFGKGKVLNHLIKDQKLNRQEVVYIGDEVRDIEAARTAGISIIAVTWGFNSEKRLEQSKPDYLITKPKQILQKVDSRG